MLHFVTSILFQLFLTLILGVKTMKLYSIINSFTIIF